MWKEYYRNGNESIHIKGNKIMVQINECITMKICKNYKSAEIEALTWKIAMYITSK